MNNANVQALNMEFTWSDAHVEPLRMNLSQVQANGDYGFSGICFFYFSKIFFSYFQVNI